MEYSKINIPLLVMLFLFFSYTDKSTNLPTRVNDAMTDVNSSVRFTYNYLMHEIYLVSSKGLPSKRRVKESTANAGDTEDMCLIPGLDSLEEEMRTHSSILAWRISWTEEPGWLPSMELLSQM